MIDHITLHVSNAERSIAFYTKALSPLGYIPKAHHEPTIGFGVDDGTPRSDFYISPMDGPAQQPIPTHIAFRATNEQAVRDFFMKPRSRQAEWITADPDHVPTIPGITRPSCSTPTAITSSCHRLVAHKPIMKSAAESQKVIG